MSHRRRNRTNLRRGLAIRESDCIGRRGGKGQCSELLPAVPGLATTSGPIDGDALAAELLHLATLARRGWST
jgi:hypothetical protein